jgi:hypothetical protein
MFEQRPESLCGVSGITAEAWKASDGYNLLQKASVKIPGRGQGRTVAVGEKTPITASCGIVLEKVDLLGGQAAMYVSETPIRPGAKDSKLQYINQEKP